MAAWMFAAGSQSAGVDIRNADGSGASPSAVCLLMERAKGSSECLALQVFDGILIPIFGFNLKHKKVAAALLSLSLTQNVKQNVVIPCSGSH